jgi:hypothetical protein
MDTPRPLESRQLDVNLMRHIDAVCRRFESDWRAGSTRPLDDYLTDVPDEARTALT